MHLKVQLKGPTVTIKITLFAHVWLLYPTPQQCDIDDVATIRHLVDCRYDELLASLAIAGILQLAEVATNKPAIAEKVNHFKIGTIKLTNSVVLSF
jgi:hypothetical protein